MHRLSEYKSIQSIAKLVLDEIEKFVSSESTEKSIIEDCKNLLSKYGLTETWYYDVPALVLLGTRSCLSISGKNYKPNNELVGSHNLISIDLSPCINDIWGDCARSFVFENGKATKEPTDELFIKGFSIERKLHNELLKYATTDISFEDLFFYFNNMIFEFGYENLDFAGNLGHSIVNKKEDRIYIEKGNSLELGSVKLFTFEPHIREIGNIWGYKYENIYYFNENNHLVEL